MGRFFPRSVALLFLWALLPVFLSVACIGDAARENPLDPGAGRFDPIAGKVLSFFEPHRPIRGVSVAAPRFGIADTTDREGKFELLYIPPESCLVVAHSAAYAASSLLVASGPAPRLDVRFYLDALPQLTDVLIQSTYEALWYPEPYREWVSIHAAVCDPDGFADVDSVICSLPWGATVLLNPQLPLGRYSATIFGDSLGSGGVESLVGLDCHLQVWDKQGMSSGPVSVRLSRVIREVATLTEPSGLQEVGGTPMLRWLSPSPPYQASLRVKVVRVDDWVETDAWESSLIPITSDSLKVGKTLSAGQYYWAVYTIDIFNNEGRSREATFVVGSET